MLKKQIKELKEKINSGEFKVIETTPKFRKVEIIIDGKKYFNLIEVKGDAKDLLLVKANSIVSEEESKNRINVKNSLTVIDNIRKTIKRGNYLEDYDLENRKITLNLTSKKGFRTISIFIEDMPNVEKEKARFRKEIYLTFINSKEMELLKLNDLIVDNPEETLTEFFNKFVVKEVEVKGIKNLKE